jgi:hypothetical protein
MITIKRLEGGDYFGICTYEIKLNDQVLNTFEHNRPDDLPKLLQLAADAVIDGRSNLGNSVY